MKAWTLVLFFIVSGKLFAESVIPITMANIQGQKKLFENGWYIIASPIEAYKMASENSVSSHQALKRALIMAEEQSTTVSLQEALKNARETMEAIQLRGNGISKKINQKSHEVSVSLKKASERQFYKAWEKINLGYLNYSQTNRDDINRLIHVNRDFFPNLKREFKDMDEAAAPIFGSFFEYHEVNWRKHFKEGQYSFDEQYKKSGHRSNSLMGLWDILVGYGKFLYSSFGKTAALGITNVAKNSGYYSTSAVLRSYIFAHSTVYSLGANLYYSTKLGYRVLSPTFESGFLSSLALLNVVAAPVSNAGLRSAGFVNKIAVNSVAPALAGSELAITQLTERGKNAAIYITYGGLGAGEVIFEKIESGIVLGYSALSQIPPQVLLGAVNTAVFLVVDGPKLVLMAASGKIAGKNIWELPTGSVMDMKKLREAGVEFRPLSEDPKILKRVLQYAN